MLNFMQYMRGSPEDYNEWARVTKDSEWSYKELLPFFRKMETYKGQFNHGEFISQLQLQLIGRT